MNHSRATKIPTFVGSGAGPVVRAFGSEMTFHLTGEQTGGRQMLATIVAEPGHMPPLHYHENEDECFVVQEGLFAFYADGHWMEGGPGTVVFAPKMSIHSLKNVGTTTGRVLVSASPSGFEVFFSRCAEEFQKTGGPDMARIMAISAEHGIYYPAI